MRARGRLWIAASAPRRRGRHRGRRVAARRRLPLRRRARRRRAGRWRRSAIATSTAAPRRRRRSARTARASISATRSARSSRSTPKTAARRGRCRSTRRSSAPIAAASDGAELFAASANGIFQVFDDGDHGRRGWTAALDLYDIPPDLTGYGGMNLLLTGIGANGLLIQSGRRSPHGRAAATGAHRHRPRRPRHRRRRAGSPTASRNRSAR